MGEAATSIADVIRAAIPDADKDTLEHILWARTPYPMGRITARSLYKAASGWRRAQDHGIALCEFCDNKAMPGKYECEPCYRALHDGHAPPDTGE